jgi:putative ABC transport system ATP-binding protein
VIRTRGLRAGHPGGPLLCFPDCDLPQGGQLLLQGRSGSGKSTWLAVLAGLLTPAAGEVLAAGCAVHKLSGAARDRWRGRHLGLLPQRLYLSPALDVRGNLALAYFACGLPVDAAAIDRALAALGVQALAGRKPHQLSGGEAQRVALARAVLMRPQLLLADEPTASLDDESASLALALLQDAARECGATLVVATHDARVRQALAGAARLDLGQPPLAGVPRSSPQGELEAAAYPPHGGAR